MAGADHGKEHLDKTEGARGDAKRNRESRGQPLSSLYPYDKSYKLLAAEFLEIRKAEQVHGRGAFSSPNSCWRSTSLSVRG